jgi:hypothetical protein
VGAQPAGDLLAGAARTQILARLPRRRIGS